MSVIPQEPQQKCGLVAIVGRPNVGKSTLLNHLLGQKISITSRKPQTTRHRLLGINTQDAVQIVYVDTPGFHSGVNKAINRYMNNAVSGAILDVDIIVLVVDRLTWNDADQAVLQQLEQVDVPVILAINKIDLMVEKGRLLPAIDKLKKVFPFEEIFPLSGLKAHNVNELEQSIIRYLPVGPHLFPEDQITDRNSRFLAAEFIREKITRQMGDELPYEVTVEIEGFKQEGEVLHLDALILVEKAGQKKIIIGDGGSRLKLIGTEARKELEQLFDRKVMLRLWVKVKAGWSDDERALRSLGYD